MVNIPAPDKFKSSKAIEYQAIDPTQGAVLSEKAEKEGRGTDPKGTIVAPLGKVGYKGISEAVPDNLVTDALWSTITGTAKAITGTFDFLVGDPVLELFDNAEQVAKKFSGDEKAKLRALPEEQRNLLTKFVLKGEYEKLRYLDLPGTILDKLVTVGAGEYVGDRGTIGGRVGETIGEFAGYAAPTTLVAKAAQKLYKEGTQAAAEQFAKNVAKKRPLTKIDAAKQSGAEIVETFAKDPVRAAKAELLIGGALGGVFQGAEEIIPGSGPYVAIGAGTLAAASAGAKQGAVDAFQKYSPVARTFNWVKEKARVLNDKVKSDATKSTTEQQLQREFGDVKPLTIDDLPPNMKNSEIAGQILDQMNLHRTQIEQTNQIQERIRQVIGENLDLTPAERASSLEKINNILARTEAFAVRELTPEKLKLRVEVMQRNIAKLLQFEEQIAKGIFDPANAGKNAASPSFIIDDLAKDLKFVLAKNDQDKVSLNTIIDEIQVAEGAATASRQLSGEGVTIDGTKLISPQIRQMPTEEISAKSGDIRKKLIEKRNVSEEAMTKRAEELGINDNNTNTALRPLQQKLKEELNLDPTTGEVREKMGFTPQIIKQFMKLKGPEKFPGRLTFSDWKLLRSRVGSEIALEKSKPKQRELAIFARLLDDQVYGKAGWKNATENLKKFSEEYLLKVIEPFEGAAVKKITKKSVGSTRNKPVYYNLNQTTADAFFQNNETMNQYIKLFGDDPQALGYMRDIIFDRIARTPSLLKNVGTDIKIVNPQALKTWVQSSQNRKLDSLTVPHPDKIDASGNPVMVPMKSLLDDAVATNSFVLKRNKELDAIANDINNDVLNSWLSNQGRKAAREEGLVTGQQTADDLIDTALGIKKTEMDLMDPQIARDTSVVSPSRVSPAGYSKRVGENVDPSEIGLLTALVKRINASKNPDLKAAFQGKIFDRLLANQKIIDKELGFDAPVIKDVEGLGRLFADNQTILEKVLGEKHFKDLIVLNEAWAKTLLTSQELKKAKTVGLSAFEEIFKKYTGVTTQTLAARYINWAEGRVSPRTTMVYLTSRAQTQRTLESTKGLLQEALTNPTLAKVLASEGPSSLSISANTARIIRDYFYELGLLDTTIVEPKKETMKEKSFGSSPVGPQSNMIVPKNKTTPVANAPILDRKPIPIASAPVATNKNTYASLFPQDTLGQALADSRNRGIGSLA